MIQREATISNKLGLHARASAKLTQTAARYPCRVWISRDGRRVNAKSILGVMLLAAGQGTRVVLEADGAQEEAALQALIDLIDDKFDEGE